MSTGDDTLFARWSRRKQAARQAEAATPDEAAQEADTPASEADAGSSDPQLPAAAEPAESLPSVEELTAESDLTAFLREGVPETLKRVALRRMWSLDPAIRDHVGPAECDWDFNRPE